MTDTIFVPIGDAEIDALIDSDADTANRALWRTAVYLAARVQVSQGQGTRTDRLLESEKLTPSQFAAKRLHGLRSPNTVAAYVQAWLDYAGEYPERGKSYPYPVDENGEELDFPGTRAEDRVAPEHRVPSMTPERRETLITAAVSEGMTGAKVVDIAGNQRSLAIAIEHDEPTAKAAEAALERRKAEQDREAIRKAGGNPDMPVDTLGLDMTGIEAKRIILAIRSIASDVRGLHRRSETDQWFEYQTHLAQAAEILNQSISGINVPNSLEGIEL